MRRPEQAVSNSQHLSDCIRAKLVLLPEMRIVGRGYKAGRFTYVGNAALRASHLTLPQGRRARALIGVGTTD